MAAARKQCSYAEFDFSNTSRSLPAQSQSSKIAVPSKSPRRVVKRKNIPLEYDPIWGPTKQLDYPLKNYSSRYDWSWPGFTSEQGSPTRIGLNRTGEEKSDQGGQNSVDELYDELQDREGAYGFSLPQNGSTRFWANPQLTRDLAALKAPFSDHIGSPRTEYDRRAHRRRDSNHGYLAGRNEFRSGWWPDGPGYENITPKDPSTITPAACLLEMDPDTEPEMLFPPETRSNLHEQTVVEIKGIQAGSVMVEAGTFDLNVRQHAIYQPTNDQHSRKGHREKWSNNVRFCYNEVASKGIFTGRLNNQIDTLFFPKKMSFQGSCGSTSSAKIGGSDLLSHSVSEETIAPYELDLFGRDWIRRWKGGPGHNKDWRSSRYLKSMRKGERAKYQLSSLGRRSYLNPSKATNHHLAITQFPPHIAVPKDMLRQKSTSCQGLSSYLKPNSSWQAMNEVGLNRKTIFSPKSRARCEPWMTKLIDVLDIEEAWTPTNRFSANSEVSNATIDDLLTAMVSTHTETPSPNFKTPNAKSISLNHLLAYESFVDTILGACLRLKRLVRTESHYELYDAESLFDGNQKYEVRAYDLRGLSSKARKYRSRNLDRAEERSSWIGSLEHGGKRWLAFVDARGGFVPEPSRECGPLWCTKEEYERAFPVLKPHKPYNSEKSKKEALQDGAIVEAYDATFEEALEEELSKRLDVNQALEVIDRRRERLVASFKSCHNDDKITPISEKRKKMKSPEQAKRLRDRQRLSRQTKRMAKAALRLGTNSDRLSQTLHMTSGPATETFGGNENNHVATNRTIGNQMQEDVAKPWYLHKHTIDNQFQMEFERICRRYTNPIIDKRNRVVIDGLVLCIL